MAFQNDDISMNTYIGQGAAVSGDIKIPGGTRIEGDIDGNLETTGKIMIGENARIRGNISAKSAIIGGIVEGNIIAPEKIQLFETAAVFGDIVTHRLEIADNVIFHGHCIALSDSNKYDEAIQNWRDTVAIRLQTNFTAKGVSL